MLPPNQLYQRMTHVSQRYDMLKGLFDAFEQLASTGLVANDCPVKGLAFESQPQDNLFRVRFAGRVIQFAFSAFVNEQGSWLGKVTCHLYAPIAEEVIEDVGSFTFNGQGYSSLKLPGDGDDIRISDAAGAQYLVLHHIYDAVHKA